jgi:hypothetical protein
MRRAIGDGLVVGDEYQQLDSRFLQPDTIRQCAEVMTYVQRPGGPVSGQDAERAGITLDGLLEFGAPLLARQQ